MAVIPQKFIGPSKEELFSQSMQSLQSGIRGLSQGLQGAEGIRQGRQQLDIAKNQNDRQAFLEGIAPMVAEHPTQSIAMVLKENPSLARRAGTLSGYSGKELDEYLDKIANMKPGYESVLRESEFHWVMEGKTGQPEGGTGSAPPPSGSAPAVPPTATVPVGGTAATTPKGTSALGGGAGAVPPQVSTQTADQTAQMDVDNTPPWITQGQDELAYYQAMRTAGNKEPPAPGGPPSFGHNEGPIGVGGVGGYTPPFGRIDAAASPQYPALQGAESPAAGNLKAATDVETGDIAIEALTRERDKQTLGSPEWERFNGLVENAKRQRDLAAAELERRMIEQTPREVFDPRRQYVDPTQGIGGSAGTSDPRAQRGPRPYPGSGVPQPQPGVQMPRPPQEAAPAPQQAPLPTEGSNNMNQDTGIASEKAMLEKIDKAIMQMDPGDPNLTTYLRNKAALEKSIKNREKIREADSNARAPRGELKPADQLPGRGLGLGPPATIQQGPAPAPAPLPGPTTQERVFPQASPPATPPATMAPKLTPPVSGPTAPSAPTPPPMIMNPPPAAPQGPAPAPTGPTPDAMPWQRLPGQGNLPTGPVERLKQSAPGTPEYDGAKRQVLALPGGREAYAMNAPYEERYREFGTPMGLAPESFKPGVSEGLIKKIGLQYHEAQEGLLKHGSDTPEGRKARAMFRRALVSMSKVVTDGKAERQTMEAWGRDFKRQMQQFERSQQMMASSRYEREGMPADSDPNEGIKRTATTARALARVSDTQAAAEASDVNVHRERFNTARERYNRNTLAVGQASDARVAGETPDVNLHRERYDTARARSDRNILAAGGASDERSQARFARNEKGDLYRIPGELDDVNAHRAEWEKPLDPREGFDLRYPKQMAERYALLLQDPTFIMMGLRREGKTAELADYQFKVMQMRDPAYQAALRQQREIEAAQAIVALETVKATMAEIQDRAVARREARADRITDRQWKTEDRTFEREDRETERAFKLEEREHERWMMDQRRAVAAIEYNTKIAESTGPDTAAVGQGRQILEKMMEIELADKGSRKYPNDPNWQFLNNALNDLGLDPFQVEVLRYTIFRNPVFQKKFVPGGAAGAGTGTFGPIPRADPRLQNPLAPPAKAQGGVPLSPGTNWAKKFTTTPTPTP